METYSGLLSFDREAFREDTGQYQLQFIVKDSGVPVRSDTANLSLSLVVSNESSNLAGIHVDDEEISRHNLVIAIALNTITLFVGLLVLLVLYMIELKYRNAANYMRL